MIKMGLRLHMLYLYLLIYSSFDAAISTSDDKELYLTLLENWFHKVIADEEYGYSLLKSLRNIYHGVNQKKLSCTAGGGTNNDCQDTFTALCGAISMEVSLPRKCQWKIHLPRGLCPNITIAALPNSDPFALDTFRVNISNNDNSILLKQNVPYDSVFTISERMVLTFELFDLVEMSRLEVIYQASICGRKVTKNPVSAFWREFGLISHPKLSLTSTDGFMYNFLIRGIVIKELNIIAFCPYHNDQHMTIYDGPWHSVPILAQVNKASCPVRVTASTFQVFIIIKSPTIIHQSSKVLRYVSSNQYDRSVETIMLDKTFSKKWNFENTTSTVYERILLWVPDGFQLSYVIDSIVPQGHQGFHCQFGGLAIINDFINPSAQYGSYSEHLFIGPICNSVGSKVLENQVLHSLTGKVSLVIYQYGHFFQSKGSITFTPTPKSLLSCYGLINPCFFCRGLQDGPLTFGLYSKIFFEELRFSCTNKVLIIKTKLKCITIVLIANEYIRQPLRCSFALYYLGMNTKYQVSLKTPWLEQSQYGNIQSKNIRRNLFRSLKLPNIVQAALVPDRIYELAMTENEPIPYYHIVIKSLKVVVTISATTAEKTCLQVQMDKLPTHSEHVATCLSILAGVDRPLNKTVLVRYITDINKQVIHNQFALKVEWKSFHQRCASTSLSVRVIDHILGSSELMLTYEYGASDIPFTFTSKGNHLGLKLFLDDTNINSSSNSGNFKSCQLKLEARSVFRELHREKQEGYFFQPKLWVAGLFTPCPEGWTYEDTSFSCYKAVDDFNGTWIDAEAECTKQGGYLWSVNSFDEWVNILDAYNKWHLVPAFVENWDTGSVHASVRFFASPVVFLGLSHCETTMGSYACKNNTDNYMWSDEKSVVYNKWNTPQGSFKNPIIGSKNSKSVHRLMREEDFVYIKERLEQYHPNMSYGKCSGYIPTTDSWVNIDCDRAFDKASFVCERQAPKQQNKNKHWMHEQLDWNFAYEQYPRFDCQTNCSEPTNRTIAPKQDKFCGSSWNSYMLKQEVCIKHMFHDINQSVVSKERLCKEEGGKLLRSEDVQRMSKAGGSSCDVMLILKKMSSFLSLIFNSNPSTTFDWLLLQVRFTGGYYHSSSLHSVETDPHSWICIKDPELNDICRREQFKCDNDECVLRTYKCDGTPQCLDGSDERNCEKGIDTSIDLIYRCVSGEHIVLSRLCDMVKDCPQGDDESECPDIGEYIKEWSPLVLRYFKPVSDSCYHKTSKTSLCVSNGKHCLFASKDPYNFESIISMADEHFVCSLQSEICYPKKYSCRFDRSYFGDILPCLHSQNLANCREVIKYCDSCGNMFRCKVSHYCIPLRLVCDGVTDCTYGDDEIGCEDYTCPGALRCSEENICVEPSEVCDGYLHCPFSGDDEAFCPDQPCPDQCICMGRTMVCNLNSNMPWIYNLNHIGVVTVQGIGNFPNFTINLTNAWYLDIANNQLADGEFLETLVLPRLTKLDLSNNKLRYLTTRNLKTFRRLKYLNVSHNPLQIIQDNVFESVKRLQKLTLSHTRLDYLPKSVFKELNNLKLLDLSYSNFETLHSDTFVHNIYLEQLSILGNDYQLVSKDIFTVLQTIEEWKLSTSQLCCLENSVVAEACISSKISCINMTQRYTDLVWNILSIIVTLNVISLLVIKFSKRGRAANTIASLCLVGLLRSGVLGTLAFMINKMHMAAMFDAKYQESRSCVAIAIGALFCKLLHFIYLLVYKFQIWHMTRNLTSGKGHLKIIYINVSLAASAACVLALSISLFWLNGNNNICMIKLGKIEAAILSVIIGGVTIAMLVMSVSVLKTLAFIRKASGRKYSDMDRTIFKKTIIETVTNTMAFIVHLLNVFLPNNWESDAYILTLIDCSIHPITTPVINGMLTRNAFNLFTTLLNIIKSKRSS